MKKFFNHFSELQAFGLNSSSNSQNMNGIDRELSNKSLMFTFAIFLFIGYIAMTYWSRGRRARLSSTSDKLSNPFHSGPRNDDNHIY